MNNFDLQVDKMGGRAVIRIKSYFNDEMGAAVEGALMPVLKSGTNRIIIDFSECELVNSQGISALLEMAIKTKEDFFGFIIFCAPSELMREVFTLAGLIPFVQAVPDLETAMKMASPNG